MERFSITPKLFFDAKDHLGETPLWSVAEQALYWVNCENPAKVHRWTASSGSHEEWLMPERVGGVVLKQGGGLVVTLGGGLYDFDPGTGQRHLLVASPMTEALLHECMCDRQGRMWVGGFDPRMTSGNLKTGGAAFFRLDNDRLVQILSGISCSNGLAFSPDGGTLYHADSATGTVMALTLDPATGAVLDSRIFCQLSPEEGFVDGATVDSDGGYWVTLLITGRLRRYWPDGTPDREIALPFNTPTKITFGGADLCTMFITTTKLPMGQPASVFDGGIYAFRPGFQGLPEAEVAV